MKVNVYFFDLQEHLNSFSCHFQKFCLEVSDCNRDDKYFLYYTNIDKFRYPGNLFSEISYHIDLMLFLFPENICSFIFSVMIL